MAAVLAFSHNQSHLSDINQITLPGNEPRQTVKTTSQNRLLQFLETASCQPITPDVVLYNRIFKTGSETTGALFSFVAAMMNYIYTRGKYQGDFFREFNKTTKSIEKCTISKIFGNEINKLETKQQQQS